MQQAWDKNGRIYYIDDNGNKVQPKSTLNAFQKLGNNFKALKTNVKNTIDNLGLERSHTYFAPFIDLQEGVKQGFTSKRELPYLAQGRADQEIREANKQQKESQVKNYVGTAISATSAHPLLNIPYIGTGLGGAVYELGQGIASGDNVGDVIDRTKQGFIVGETVGAVPYVGKGLGKTKAGQAVGNQASKLFDYLANTKAGQKVAEIAPKVEDVLMTDIKAFNPNKQTVYHGSPYDFTKFSNKAIGTGEGAQAHGYGHYAAKNKDIAEKYRQILSEIPHNEKIQNRLWYDLKNDRIPQLKDNEERELFEHIAKEITPSEFNTRRLKWYFDSLETPQAKEYADILLNELENNNNQGNLYKLSIPKDDVMLREDLPINQQPKAVQDAINKINQKLGFGNYEDLSKQSLDVSNQIKNQYNFKNIDWQKVRELESLQDEITKKMTAVNPNIIGKNYYKSIGKNSNLLNQHGIKGISYNGGIDGEARVIFNPDDIDIVRKYYNQPQVMEYLQNLQPSLGAVVNTKEWK